MPKRGKTSRFISRERFLTKYFYENRIIILNISILRRLNTFISPFFFRNKIYDKTTEIELFQD